MSPDPELSGHKFIHDSAFLMAMVCIVTIIATCLATLIFNCKLLTIVACLYVAWKLAWKLLDWSVSKFLRN